MARRSSSTSPTDARAAVKLPYASIAFPISGIDTVRLYRVYLRKRALISTYTRSSARRFEPGQPSCAHDPNDTRYATLRRPSHHDMHAQNANPDAFVPRTASCWAIDLVAATDSISDAHRTALHALRISYMQAHVIRSPGCLRIPRRLIIHVVFRSPVP